MGPCYLWFWTDFIVENIALIGLSTTLYKDSPYPQHLGLIELMNFNIDFFSSF